MGSDSSSITALQTDTAEETTPGDATTGASMTGLLPSQDIRALISTGHIHTGRPIEEAQVQPASLDLRLGAVAYRVRASFLPGEKAMVADRLNDLGMHRFDLSNGAVLERGCVYIVPLIEKLALDKHTVAIANPKSSTGRLDVFTRLIADRATVFDQAPAGYTGALFAEISPRTFSVVVREGASISQLRFRRGGEEIVNPAATPAADGTAFANAECGEADVRDGLAVTVGLAPQGEAPVGWRARHHAGLIDLARVDHYAPEEFWEPVRPDAGGFVVLNPGDFYILASKEAVVVPPDQAAEMRPYDTRVGEFRVHYAGFFDPGFGYAGANGAGSRAVLEIRPFEVPFVLRDGQLVGRLVYERLTAVPDKLYGSGIGSSYQRQGLMLAKQFRRG